MVEGNSSILSSNASAYEIIPRFPLLVAGVFVATALVQVEAALPFFGKDEAKEVPPSEELQRQNDEAKALLDKALAAKGEGHPDKAEDYLKDVTERYPLSSVSATAQFELGRILEEEQADQGLRRLSGVHREGPGERSLWRSDPPPIRAGQLGDERENAAHFSD